MLDVTFFVARISTPGETSFENRGAEELVAVRVGGVDILGFLARVGGEDGFDLVGEIVALFDGDGGIDEDGVLWAVDQCVDFELPPLLVGVGEANDCPDRRRDKGVDLEGWEGGSPFFEIGTFWLETLDLRGPADRSEQFGHRLSNV